MTEQPSRIKHYRTDDWKDGVDVGLRHTHTTRDVYWDRIGNSYVAVASNFGEFLVDGVRVNILSINGMGEVRWAVTADTTDVRDKAAARHFDAVELSPYAERHG